MSSQKSSHFCPILLSVLMGPRHAFSKVLTLLSYTSVCVDVLTLLSYTSVCVDGTQTCLRPLYSDICDDILNAPGPGFLRMCEYDTPTRRTFSIAVSPLVLHRKCTRALTF